MYDPLSFSTDRSQMTSIICQCVFAVGDDGTSDLGMQLMANWGT